MKAHFQFLFLALLALCSAQKVYSDSSVLNTEEGINGEMDKKRREPTVSVETIVQTNNVKLLVDAYIAASEYQKYPIQFDFYVNRHFFTSQIRSSDLPGPIGVDIPPSLATPPFNFTVIAKTLHPNSVYTTVFNGAAFTSNVSGSLDCTLTTNAEGDESVEYVANSVSPTQSGNDSISVQFETDSTPEGHSVELTSSVTLSGTTASGNLNITVDGGETQTVEVSGDSAKDGDDLTSLNLSSSDGSVTLVCS